MGVAKILEDLSNIASNNILVHLSHDIYLWLMGLRLGKHYV